MQGKSLVWGEEQGNKKLNCCDKGNKGPDNSQCGKGQKGRKKIKGRKIS